MAFPPLPGYIADTGRYRVHHDMPPRRSTPAMSIPGLDAAPDAPPPLPPPRYVPLYDAPPPQPDDRCKDSSRVGAHASSSFASGYGSMDSSYADDRPVIKRRDTASTANGDEGYASYASAERPREPLPPDISFRHSRRFQTAADLHTDTMKRKLDHVRPVDKSPSLSLLTSSIGDLSRRQAEPGLSPGMPLQLPIHGRLNPRWHPEMNESECSPRVRPRRNNSDDATSTRGSFYDCTGAEDLEVDDAHTAAGQKRRAASPAHEVMLTGVSGPSDGVRRRDVASRGSPTLRLATICQPLPASSMPPAVLSWSSSLVPSASVTSAGITPANSFGRRSPGGMSPGGMSPISCSSPYATPASLTHSPRGSMSARVPGHGRASSANSPRKLDVHKPGSAKLQDFFMCDCCPKKPKKFPTAEELSAHEAEKQYGCCYCRNRFKNKNEAERHQNSLHVRRHSWSCSALSGYDRAFHDSTSRPGEYDTCGYCGDEFPRSGRGPGSGALNDGIVPKHVTDVDWEDRIRHLQDVHKFRECNAAKKFYRADHFRQHLKHSHAGTSGKWTNMLENACMIEEEAVSR